MAAERQLAVIHRDGLGSFEELTSPEVRSLAELDVFRPYGGVRGLAVSVTYNSSPSAPSAVGNYPVIATVTDSNYTGSANATLTIASSVATVTLSNLSHTPSWRARTRAPGRRHWSALAAAAIGNCSNPSAWRWPTATQPRIGTLRTAF